MRFNNLSLSILLLFSKIKLPKVSRKFRKVSLLAAKSVSLLTLIRTVISLFKNTPTAPSFAALSLFFDALARPFFLRASIEFSILLLFSSNDFLQSKKPAPVLSLSSFISLLKKLESYQKQRENKKDHIKKYLKK